MSYILSPINPIPIFDVNNKYQPFIVSGLGKGDKIDTPQNIDASNFNFECTPKSTQIVVNKISICKNDQKINEVHPQFTSHKLSRFIFPRVDPVTL